MFQPKKEFMEAAIEEAIKTKKRGDYKVGAVIVKDNKIIARSGNRGKIDSNPIYHAETVAIMDASKLLGTRHLENCILYTTHEPCPMCTSATIWAKIKTIVFGASIEDMKEFILNKGNWRVIDIPSSKIIEKGDQKITLIGGFMREECKKLFYI